MRWPIILSTLALATFATGRQQQPMVCYRFDHRYFGFGEDSVNIIALEPALDTSEGPLIGARSGKPDAY